MKVPIEWLSDFVPVKLSPSMLAHAFDMIGIEDDKPVVLDFESIRALKPGKFEIDIRHLFKREPLVYKMADGKYFIDIPSTFQLRKKKN